MHSEGTDSFIHTSDTGVTLESAVEEVLHLDIFISFVFLSVHMGMQYPHKDVPTAH